MTSTKSFSTKNAGILIVAIFSIAISLGLSQVSSVMAQNDVVGCTTEVDEESNDTEMNNARSCADEDQEEEEEEEVEESDATDSDNDSTDTQAATVSSPNNDDDEDESDSSSDNVTTQPQNVVTSGPASADPEDNIIKPINLNKGFVSDKPLKTNNVKNSDQDEDKGTMKVIEDKFEFKQQLKKPSAVSEIYESFDLPYTALYKNP